MTTSCVLFRSRRLVKPNLQFVNYFFNLLQERWCWIGWPRRTTASMTFKRSSSASLPWITSTHSSLLVSEVLLLELGVGAMVGVIQPNFSPGNSFRKGLYPGNSMRKGLQVLDDWVVVLVVKTPWPVWVATKGRQDADVCSQDWFRCVIGRRVAPILNDPQKVYASGEGVVINEPFHRVL